MTCSRTTTSAGLCFFLATASIASSSASDLGVAADFHDELANGFCTPEFLAIADSQLARCKSALETPARLCANETLVHDTIASKGLADEEWQARSKAVSGKFTECLFSNLQLASESADNPDREIHAALFSYYAPQQEFEETESEYFTDDEIASGKFDEYFSEQAQVMNEDLPIMVDEISRLDRVTYSSRVFREHYTIVGVTLDETRIESNPDAVQQFFISNACNHEPSRNAMEEGVEFAYEFRSEDGSKHTEFSVSSTDCESQR